MASIFDGYPREVDMRVRRVIHSKKDFQRYINNTNGKANMTVTVYPFKELKPGGNRCEYTTAIIPHFVVDLDKGRAIEQLKMTDEEAGQRCTEDTLRLSNYLAKKGWKHSVFFSGGGYHIWVLLDRVYDLPPDQLSELLFSGRVVVNRWVKEMGLISLDPVVSFRPDRHIRVPNTYNVKRGLWSIPVNEKMLNEGWSSITKRAEEPSGGLFVRGTEGMPLEIVNRNEVEYRMSGLSGFFGKFDAAEIEVEMKNVDGIPMLPCLKAACCEKGSNPPHQPRVYLMMYLLDYFRRFARPPHESSTPNKEAVNKAHAFIESLSWSDYKPAVTHQMLSHGASRYYLTPTCPKLFNEGLCVGRCPFYDGKGV